MTEINSGKNYMCSLKRRGKMTNVPLGNTGHQSSGKLTKDGLVFKNDLLDTDYTSQTATRRKLKGVQ
jgi:hypothetical protein